jgi:hypothetical protein
MPPSPVLTFAAHSRQTPGEKGKSFVHFLQTGFLHSEQLVVAGLVSQM